jgi:hypothetical protein
MALLDARKALTKNLFVEYSLEKKTGHSCDSLIDFLQIPPVRIFPLGIQIISPILLIIPDIIQQNVCSNYNQISTEEEHYFA